MLLLLMMLLCTRLLRLLLVLLSHPLDRAQVVVVCIIGLIGLVHAQERTATLLRCSAAALRRKIAHRAAMNGGQRVRTAHEADQRHDAQAHAAMPMRRPFTPIEQRSCERDLATREAATTTATRSSSVASDTLAARSSAPPLFGDALSWADKQ